jgi:RimJ/RimL family protein N-acetyltransferase
MEDIEPSYIMNLDAEVSKHTGDGGVVSKEEIERRIVENVFGDYEKHGFGRLAVELKGENKFIGFTGLKYLEDMDEVDLGYRFMKEYWGKGIATESAKACVNLGFNKLGLKRLIAMVLPENIGSIRVLEKLNFEFEKEIIEDNQLSKIYSLIKEKAPNKT